MAWMGWKSVSIRTMASRVRVVCSTSSATRRASAASRWSSADSDDTQAHPLGVAVVRTSSPSPDRTWMAVAYSSLLQPSRRHTDGGVQPASWTAMT